MTEHLVPEWPAPPGVHALSTTRVGGVSKAPWNSFNLGDHVGDAPDSVRENRARLGRQLPAEPLWLNQVHGTRCVDASLARAGVEADAAFTRQRGVVCAVLTADCLPVLLCDDAASVVGVAHAGWRGLAAGVIESAVASMNTPGDSLMAWLGPAIGPQAFEVGGEVRATFVDHDSQAANAFVATPNGKWMCDIYALARQRLQALGVRRIAGPRSGSPGVQSTGPRSGSPGVQSTGPRSGSPGVQSTGAVRGDTATHDFCTVTDSGRFFSYRRDGVTGRMASLIWLE